MSDETTPAESQPQDRKDKRTIILAVAAVCLIGLLLLDSLFSGEAKKPTGSTASKKTAAKKSFAPLGAPVGVGSEALLERYKVILEARPFVRRSFRPKPKRAPVVRRPARKPERDPQPVKPSGPPPISVRLTGLIGDGTDRSAVLENYTTGEGLFLKQGTSLGPYSVVRVEAATLVVKDGSGERTLALGDALTLPASAKSHFKKLGPKRPDPGTVPERGRRRSRSGYKPPIKLSAGRRKSILERLKARRRAALAKKNKKKKEGKK